MEKTFYFDCKSCNHNQDADIKFSNDEGYLEIKKTVNCDVCGTENHLTLVVRIQLYAK